MILPRPDVHCDYRGPMTDLPCANPDALPHACYTAADDCPDRHDASEANHT